MTVKRSNKVANDLISRFIIGGSYSNPIKNEKLLKLYDNFRIDYNDKLPIVKPNYVMESPFQFHSKYNGDKSYIDSPRLSVTKLLSESWCELRDYYLIYSGSIREPKGKPLLLGTQYHLELELADFEIIDIEAFEAKLSEIEGLEDQAQKEDLLAIDWFENICVKLFSLITKSHSRELLVHGHLNINNAEFEISKDSIVISGVIDYLQLLNNRDPTDFSMFEEIQNFIEFNHYLDLSAFFNITKATIDNYDYSLKITDVKTRQFNNIPNQMSVLKSAFLQTCYYKKFFELLASNEVNSYNMLIKNANVRHCDLDKPISYRTLLILLRKYPEFLLNDFKNLSTGKPIGFEPFDTYTQNNKFDYDYDLSNIFTKEDLKALNDLDNNFDYNTVFNQQIFKKWKTPLTLRYFAARSSQFFNLFKPMSSDLLSIEYHNVKTGHNFKTLEYNFSESEFNTSVQRSCAFWSGRKTPTPIDDLSKCKYCDFSTKCPVPNRDLKSVGIQLNHFLSS